MKRIVPILLSMLLLTACTAPQISEFDSNSIKNESETKKITYRQISVAQAIAMMEEESGYIILDVRTPEEFAEKRIPNSINVPNESIGNGEISELPNKQQLILVYCRSGRRSKEAAQKLCELGYTNIVEFGGIINWTGDTVSG